MGQPASFLFIFGLFKQAIQFLQQINVKICHVHLVNGGGIQTHDLSHMSRLPLPLDQGSCHSKYKFHFLFPTRNGRHHPIEDNKDLSAAEKRHARVKRWTKSVNIFDKDFIIVPINEASHW